ncbi:non-hydrolyzing UDP-N-acetylglucosamine 2-epimerase [Cellulomonas bogoriensis]|uniref:UDP-N-acetylglucosamine 2-epimerase n=1 Tax=Cellulomonas bogoriensis 69B4 = DSM 16987 TaxID=1386082 RepID=A0A0A0BVP2_9CELL|nr:UDP-N-acetylglucosamine 2-epimerase (non-hydrolyzing) [Cellulomonas bogoriensis]KGM11209.1 UDP-N-acetylglucosamine 2-epimerase [Cellulomonas bogoriensis 69B4 = DSM 16987]
MTGPFLHVVGARPNFPKAAPVLHALRDRGQDQLLVHTGQHYDDAMSRVFLDELGIPHPDRNLAVGSGTHAVQTAATMVRLEEVFTETRPRTVVVYGDVNSTVAAALVAAKLHIPVAHVEAGLRSFDRTMPEEINRLVTDQLSDVLLATSADAIDHLTHEGVPEERTHLVGNPMIDTLLANLDRADNDAARATHGLTGDYAVATMHRPANVDTPDRAQAVVATLHGIADQVDVVLPLHPRARPTLTAAGVTDHPRVHVIEPRPYLEFIGLVRGARLVVTDSGGIQEETTVLGVPCLTLRPNTERPVTITHGTNRLVTFDDVLDHAQDVLAVPRAQTWPVPPLWDGKAGQRIADVLVGT